jgi:arylsulfatase A
MNSDRRPGVWCANVLVALVSIIGAAATAAESSVGRRPHVVLCMADDQGWGDVGFRGHSQVQTPVLDEMARTGLRFDRFYAAAPVCSPTRASVLTGRHPNRMGCFDWGYTLRPQERTIAEVLQAAGYATGHFGKWHLGSVRADSPVNPGASGFDEWLSSPNFFEFDPVLSHNGRVVETRGEGSRVIVDAALDWMERQVDEEKPILAVIWFGSPHKPHVGSPEGIAAYAAAPAKQRAFLAEVTGIDTAMGELRQGLHRLGIANDTLLWYCSDNGAIAEGSTGGLRGGKGNLFEGGIRVPAIIEWPAVVRESRVITQPCSTCDIYPTVLAAAGAAVPQQPILDGRSLLPLIEAEPGKQAEAGDRGLGFWVYEPALGKKCNTKELMLQQQAEERGELPRSPAPDLDAARILPIPEDGLHGSAAWIEGRWKALLRSDESDEPRAELFDLEADAAERHDLSAAEPARLNAMLAELQRWRRSVIASCNGADYESSAPAASRSDQRPNVLLLVSDDQGYGDLGCFGSTEIYTPNLDRLAAAGVRLTEFYVTAPACTPSRASLLTGRYPPRHGLTDMIRNEAPDYGHRYATDEYEVTFERTGGLDVREVLLPALLSKAGYACGMIGKWDLGSQRRFLPTSRGFDAFYGFVNTGIDYFTHERYGVPSMYRNDQATTADRGSYTTDLFLHEAEDFIRSQRDGPFFAYVAFNAPHSASNLDPAVRSAAQSMPKYQSLYPELAAAAGDQEGKAYGKLARVPNNAARRLHHVASITHMDFAIGELMDLLDELGIAERTLVLFLSDNGGTKIATNKPLRGTKSQLYEGGVRVPAIAVWPGSIPPATIRSGIVSTLDVLPTILAVCRIPAPPRLLLDGHDLMPYLVGTAESPRTSLCWRWRDWSAARSGRWKWHRSPAGEALFDLAADPGESEDLVAQNPGELAMMQAEFAAWQKDMDAAEPREPFRDH